MLDPEVDAIRDCDSASLVIGWICGGSGGGGLSAGAGDIKANPGKAVWPSRHFEQPHRLNTSVIPPSIHQADSTEGASEGRGGGGGGQCPLLQTFTSYERTAHGNCPSLAPVAADFLLSLTTSCFPSKLTEMFHFYLIEVIFCIFFFFSLNIFNLLPVAIFYFCIDHLEEQLCGLWRWKVTSFMYAHVNMWPEHRCVDGFTFGNGL